MLSELSQDLDEGGYRDRVDELYSVVVFDRKRPLFRGESDPVKVIYDSAISILNGITANSWHGTDEGEYNTVHAVHDYLVCNVEYDFELYDRYGGTGENSAELAYEHAFHIDGALVERVAVCDGLAKAFDFLCAIEGIESARVTGLLGSAPHAWNKVKLFGNWYNVDITADTANYSLDGKMYKQLSHGYFLTSDRTVTEFKALPHSFSDPAHVAEYDRDFYGDKTVTLCGSEYKLEITSYTELENLFKAIGRDGKVGKIEIKLSYPEKTDVNLADMYKDDIRRAYGVIKNADFGFSNGALPYFMYPNGVYLILIKK